MPGADNGFLIQAPDVYQYHAGDTLVIKAGEYSYFDMDNFRGASACPLVIINEGGQVKFTGTKGGFHITNSSYVKITGTGSRDKFGFFVEGDPVYRPWFGAALLVHLRSKNVEISHVDIHNMGFGFLCRTDNYCEDSLTYPNWILDSMSIHDCRMVGIWFEGMYMGNTSPDNAADSYDPRPIVCNGDTVYPLPMRNGNMIVYNNYVDSTGRGGIQLASASKGMSEIYNNTVMHNGMNGDTDQGTGISIGAYAHAYVHDNKVNNTYTWGIASLGGSGTGTALRIENNTVDSSGYLATYDLSVTSKRKIHSGTEPLFKDTLDWPGSIYVGTRSTRFTDSTTFRIKNNTIGKSKSKLAAIQVYDDYFTMTKSGNIVSGNKNAVSGTKPSLFVSEVKGKFSYQKD
jgi:hypothetical protein